MIKKISYSDSKKLMLHFPYREWVLPFLSYSIEKIDDSHYDFHYDETKVMYFIFFIPAIIFQFICLLWDGGIKNFEILRPAKNVVQVWNDSKNFSILSELYERGK